MKAALDVKRVAAGGDKTHLLRGVVGVGVVAFLCEDDVEDGVRATARLVHVGGSHSPAQTADTSYQWVCF